MSLASITVKHDSSAPCVQLKQTVGEDGDMNITF